MNVLDEWFNIGSVTLFYNLCTSCPGDLACNWWLVGKSLPSWALGSIHFFLAVLNQAWLQLLTRARTHKLARPDQAKSSQRQNEHHQLMKTVIQMITGSSMMMITTREHSPTLFNTLLRLLLGAITAGEQGSSKHLFYSLSGPEGLVTLDCARPDTTTTTMINKCRPGQGFDSIYMHGHPGCFHPPPAGVSQPSTIETGKHAESIWLAKSKTLAMLVEEMSKQCLLLECTRRWWFHWEVVIATTAPVSLEQASKPAHI